MNDKSFEHIGSNGCTLRATRCDFRDGVVLELRSNDTARIAEDIAACIGYHAMVIRPKLDGFQGYDAINFTLNMENLGVTD